MASFLSRFRLYFAPLVFFAASPLEPTLRERSLAACFASLTVGAYIFNKVTDLEEDERNPSAEPLGRGSVKTVLVMAMLAIFGPIVYLAAVSEAHLVLYVALVALGIWYSYRIPVFGKRVRLKDVLVIKNVVTALGWTAVIVAVPWLSRPDTKTWPAELAQTFSVLMLISLMWDVRDLEGDTLAGVRTVANTWGIAATKIIICVVLLPTIVVVGVKLRNPLEVTFFPTVVATLITVVAANSKRSPGYYHAVALFWVIDVVAFRAGWRVATAFS